MRTLKMLAAVAQLAFVKLVLLSKRFAVKSQNFG